MDYLAILHSTHQLLWLVLGDFNELIAYVDKNGGPYMGIFGGFCTWVHIYDAMIDLGFRS